MRESINLLSIIREKGINHILVIPFLLLRVGEISAIDCTNAPLPLHDSVDVNLPSISESSSSKTTPTRVEILNSLEIEDYLLSQSLFGGYFSNLVDSVGNGINLLMCQFKVFSFATIGIAVIFIVLCLLTRDTITSSSETRTATIILVVLGALCSWAGKFSVGSLGGSGYHWLVHWEALCLLHAFATCFTPWLFYFLNGSSSKARTFGNSVFPF